MSADGTQIVGASPAQLASEAVSAAHQVAEIQAMDRVRQAEVNVDFRLRFDRIDAALGLVSRELGEIRGEARGAATSQKSAVVWMGLAVAALELFSHLPWSRILGHV